MKQIRSSLVVHRYDISPARDESAKNSNLLIDSHHFSLSHWENNDSITNYSIIFHLLKYGLLVKVHFVTVNVVTGYCQKIFRNNYCYFNVNASFIAARKQITVAVIKPDVVQNGQVDEILEKVSRLDDSQWLVLS